MAQSGIGAIKPTKKEVIISLAILERSLERPTESRMRNITTEGKGFQGFSRLKSERRGSDDSQVNDITAFVGCNNLVVCGNGVNLAVIALVCAFRSPSLVGQEL